MEDFVKEIIDSVKVETLEFVLAIIGFSFDHLKVIFVVCAVLIFPMLFFIKKGKTTYVT
jgi:hypothetical protein